MVFLALVSVPVISAQTLAEASAKAKADRAKGQQWPASANTVPVFDPAAAAAVGTPTGDVTVASGVALETIKTTATSTTTTTVKDETYWKTRMRGVVTKLADDQAYLAAAVTNERTRNTEVHRNIDDIQAISNRRQLAVAEGQWRDAVAEVSRLKALVANDTRAKADLELEAHRAGVPPGWLILE